MKKASANIWWIIIGAAIAMIVMFVLLMIFTDQTSVVKRGISGCDSKGGKCEIVDTCTGVTSKVFECEEGKECCFT